MKPFWLNTSGTRPCPWHLDGAALIPEDNPDPVLADELLSPGVFRWVAAFREGVQPGTALLIAGMGSVIRTQSDELLQSSKSVYRLAAKER